MAPQVDTPFYAKIPTGTFLPQSPSLNELQKGIDDCERLKMRYKKAQGEEKEYLVEPLKLAFFDGFWYLLAQGPDKKQVIKFRLDRIIEAELTGKSFAPMSGLNKLLEQSVNVWFGSERPDRVLIKVASESAQYFKKRKYFPLQKIVEEKKDGSLVIETFPAHFEEISHTIMHWIPCLTVLEPAVLRDKIRQTVEGYLKEMAV
jgi:predicted DNA-binding transcriptional regulator YafY